MPTTTTTAVQLGKNVSISGVANARSCTITSSANEIDVTKFGDTSRKFQRGLIEQTIEVECVDDPGVTAGTSFTISGTSTGNATFICTAVKINSPLDGIVSYTVSGSRTA
jgi:predicted secreted protein